MRGLYTISFFPDTRETVHRDGVEPQCFEKKETQVDKSTGTKKLWKHIEYGLNKRDEGEETEVGVYGESQVSKSCRYI